MHMVQIMKNHSSHDLKAKDDVSSPLSAQILQFCDPEFFQETLHNSEVTSSSNCCYDENSSYNINFSMTPDMDNFNNCRDNSGYTNTTSPTTCDTNNINHNNSSSNLSVIFDSQDELDNDISASIDFSPSPTFPLAQFITTPQQEQFDFSSVQPQLALTDVVSAGGFSSQYPAHPVVPIMGHMLPAVFEENCLSSVPSYVPLNPSSPSSSYLGPTMCTFMPAGNMTAALSADDSAIFACGILMGSELQPSDLDYQADNAGIYCPNSIQRVFNPGDLQALGNETQQMVGGSGAASNPLATEISSLEDPTFKVGKLSVEERKEKIHRYLKKRNERNFSKKIKYACRKTLADSRPRVRGRFAKNDDFGETPRTACSNHEEDDDDDDVMVKEEDDRVNSADIFAHISGVNSFKCNYSIQSWVV